MTFDDLTLIASIGLWIALLAITLWVGVPRRDD